MRSFLEDNFKKYKLLIFFKAVNEKFGWWMAKIEFSHF